MARVIMFAALLASATLVAAPKQDDAVQKWIAELEGESPAAAIAALAELDPELTVPPLAELIASGTTETRWNGLRALRAVMAGAKGKVRAAKKSVDGLVEVFENAEGEDAHRVIAALALGSLGENGTDAVGPLSAALEASRPQPHSLVAVLALVALGKPSAVRLKRSLDAESLAPAMFATSAFVLLGEEGTSAKRELLSIVESPGGSHSFSLYAIAAEALIGMGSSTARQAEEARAKREEFEVRERGPISSLDLKAGIHWALLAQLVLDAKPPLGSRELADFDLPQTADCHQRGGMTTLGNLTQPIVSHVARRIRDCDAALRADTHKTYADWAETWRPLSLSCELVALLP